jgi:hypothetical protein
MPLFNPPQNAVLKAGDQSMAGPLHVAGLIESTSGGVKLPDGSTLLGVGYTRGYSPPGVVFGHSFPDHTDAGSINDEISNIGGGEGTIHLLPGTWTIDAAVSVPDNITLLVERGAVLVKSGSGSMVIAGPFRAPSKPVFSGFAEREVTFNGPRRCVRPEWFGAVVGGSVDCTSAFAQAFAAAPAGQRIELMPGRYKVTSISSAKPVEICGSGRPMTANGGVFGGTSWATPAETGSVIESAILSGTILSLTDSGNRTTSIKNVVVKGLGNNTRTTRGIDLSNGRCLYDDVIVLNCFIGAHTDNIEDSKFNAPQYWGCGTGLSFTNNSNSNVVVGIDASANGTAVEIDASGDLQFFGGTIQGSTLYGVHGPVAGALFHGIYFENSAATAALSLDGASACEIVRCHQSTTGDVFDIGGNENLIYLHKYARGVHFLAGSFHNRCTTLGGFPSGCSDAGANNQFESVTDYGTEYYGSAADAMIISVKQGFMAGFDFKTSGGHDYSLQYRDDVGYGRLIDTDLNQQIMTFKGDAAGAKMGLWGQRPVVRPVISGVNNTALDSFFAQYADAGGLTAPTKPSSGSAAPTTGTWSVREIVYNTAPDTGQPVGWICTAAGTPGTWKAFGLIL